jgi:transglutaminase-like putative cysteine protease
MESDTGDDLSRFLCPTPFIQSAAEPIVALARSLATEDPADTAVALFNWVRDNIKYDPLCAADSPDAYPACRVLERGSGYCVQKAVLLASLARAAGIPTRLGFADVRNHQVSERFRKLIGTDLFAWHGYVEFHLGGRWVKATPAFDPESGRKAGMLPVELDGKNDAMLHPVDPEGQPFIEYVRNRGWYAELPLQEILETFKEVYADVNLDGLEGKP